MLRTVKYLLALFLVFALLLTGCGLPFPLSAEPEVESKPAYLTLPYNRPDPAQLQQLLDNCLELAQGDDVAAVEEAVLALYDGYDDFITNYSLADLNYYADVTDSYWAEESAYCTENVHMADAILEELYYGLAKSPLRQQLEGEDYFGAGFFDAYEGQSTAMDPQLLALYEREAACLNEYYDLCENSADLDPSSSEYQSNWLPQFADLMAKTIGVRQEIAAFLGFDSYADYAYELTYGRDYTPQQAAAFMDSLCAALCEDYRKINTLYIPPDRSCTEEETLSYVRTAARSMGGDLWEAFRTMEQHHLYDLTYSKNKYEISFEIYLWSYGIPFIFTHPYNDITDYLTFAHEFGHFSSDYVCSGSYVGIDVAEIQSQAFEYLSLIYGDAPEELVDYKCYDSICIYMEQSAYSSFELQAYALTGDDLTGEKLLELAKETALAYGFDSWGSDGTDFVTIGHYYTHPHYMISYVVSNDLAMQFYQLEQQESGKGLQLYQDCLYSEDSQILAFAQEYGLESPFAAGRAEAVAQTLGEALWN